MNGEPNRRQFLATAMLGGAVLAARQASGQSVVSATADDGKPADAALALVRRYSPLASLLHAAAPTPGDTIRIHAPVTDSAAMLDVLGHGREFGLSPVIIRGQTASFSFRASGATVEVEHAWHG